MESSENSTETHTHAPTKNKKQQKIHPRRFSDEQIRSLESIFKQETKLEPRKKVQIARDLCLQPRQVAIWFQNKRARWKSKQTEHQFRHLKSNYDALSTKFDDLKREKHSLEMQLQELNDRLKNRDGDDDHVINDERIITSCYRKKDHEDNEEFIRWTSGEEEMSQTWCNLFDESSENTKWWES